MFSKRYTLSIICMYICIYIYIIHIYIYNTYLLVPALQEFVLRATSWMAVVLVFEYDYCDSATG